MFIRALAKLASSFIFISRRPLNKQLFNHAPHYLASFPIHLVSSLILNCGCEPVIFCASHYETMDFAVCRFPILLLPLMKSYVHMPHISSYAQLLWFTQTSPKISTAIRPWYKQLNFDNERRARFLTERAVCLCLYPVRFFII